jgi:biopolymer transport protein ExbB
MKPLVCSLCGLLLGPIAALAQITAVAPTGNPTPDASNIAASPIAAGTTTVLDLVSGGGWAIYPLGALSVVTVMLVLTYLFTMRRGAVVSAHFMNTADVLLKKRDYHGLLAISSRHNEIVARIVQRTLDFATRNPNAEYSIVREIAETEGATQAASLQNRIVYLADIGMLSPMIGLLGTVIGIIKSFGVLASRQTAEASRNMLLAGGVSEALVATAGGLILGITSMAFYAFFRGRVQRLISDLEIASTHILGLLALNYNRRRDPNAEKSRVSVEDDF